jgi:hypothetical protein
MGLSAKYHGALGQEDLNKRMEEEQRVLALQIRMREDEMARDRAREAERSQRRAEGLPDLGDLLRFPSPDDTRTLHFAAAG